MEVGLIGTQIKHNLQMSHRQSMLKIRLKLSMTLFENYSYINPSVVVVVLIFLLEVDV